MDVQMEVEALLLFKKKKSLQYLMMAEEDAHVRRKIPAFFFLNISKQFISSFHSKNDSQGKL